MIGAFQGLRPERKPNPLTFMTFRRLPEPAAPRDDQHGLGHHDGWLTPAHQYLLRHSVRRATIQQNANRIDVHVMDLTDNPIPGSF